MSKRGVTCSYVLRATTHLIESSQSRRTYICDDNPIRLRVKRWRKACADRSTLSAHCWRKGVITTNKNTPNSGMEKMGAVGAVKGIWT